MKLFRMLLLMSLFFNGVWVKSSVAGAWDTFAQIITLGTYNPNSDTRLGGSLMSTFGRSCELAKGSAMEQALASLESVKGALTQVKVDNVQCRSALKSYTGSDPAYASEQKTASVMRLKEGLLVEGPPGAQLVFANAPSTQPARENLLLKKKSSSKLVLLSGGNVPSDTAADDASLSETQRLVKAKMKAVSEEVAKLGNVLKDCQGQVDNQVLVSAGLQVIPKLLDLGSLSSVILSPLANIMGSVVNTFSNLKEDTALADLDEARTPLALNCTTQVLTNTYCKSLELFRKKQAQAAQVCELESDNLIRSIEDELKPNGKFAFLQELANPKKQQPNPNVQFPNSSNIPNLNDGPSLRLEKLTGAADRIEALATYASYLQRTLGPKLNSYNNDNKRNDRQARWKKLNGLVSDCTEIKNAILEYQNSAGGDVVTGGENFKKTLAAIWVKGHHDGQTLSERFEAALNLESDMAQDLESYSDGGNHPVLDAFVKRSTRLNIDKTFEAVQDTVPQLSYALNMNKKTLKTMTGYLSKHLETAIRKRVEVIANEGDQDSFDLQANQVILSDLCGSALSLETIPTQVKKDCADVPVAGQAGLSYKTLMSPPKTHPGRDAYSRRACYLYRLPKGDASDSVNYLYLNRYFK